MVVPGGFARVSGQLCGVLPAQARPNPRAFAGRRPAGRNRTSCRHRRSRRHYRRSRDPARPGDAPGAARRLPEVLTEIALAQDVATLTLPPDDQLTAWVQDFEINEKTSASRYIGRFTFRFMAEPVRQFLSESGVSFAETTSKPVLVLPIYTDDTGTTELWGRPIFG